MNTDATPDFLVSASAQDALTELTDASDSSLASIATVEQLRSRGFSPSQVSALISQAQLRHRARAKFGSLADTLLFTEAGLEQASRLVVARSHATRFTEAGIAEVTDLGCGIGAESFTLAEAGVRVHAIELDPQTAQFAAYNLVRFPTTSVSCADALTTEIPAERGVFLDPARRTAGTRNTQRLTNIDDYAPPLSFAFNLAERHATAIKLGPGFPREHIPEPAHAQWTSVNGEAVEMMLWFNELATPGVTRSALVLRGSAAFELTAPRDSADVEVRTLGSYLFEPDPAVIRARLIGDLARTLSLGMIDEQIAYLTGDHPVTSPFLQSFRIHEVLPANEAKLKRLLRDRNIGELEIKKRGMDIEPAALRKRLNLRGSERATLILTRADEKRVALLCTRESSATDAQ